MVAEEQFTSLSTEDLFVSLAADLPASGLRDGARAWASDGRKDGEAADEGTGVPVYYDLAAGTWNSYRTDTEVTT